LLSLPRTVIEVGFIPAALTVSEGDGVVSAVTVEILNGGVTEQILFITIIYNSGSKKILLAMSYNVVVAPPPNNIIPL
jgi:hypothetical protein